jgi:hypothetical protein
MITGFLPAICEKNDWLPMMTRPKRITWADSSFASRCPQRWPSSSAVAM